MSIHVNETGVTKTVSDNTLFVELIYNQAHPISVADHGQPITSSKYHIQEFDLLFVTLHSIKETSSQAMPYVFNFFTSYNMLNTCGQQADNIFTLTSPNIQGYIGRYLLYRFTDSSKNSQELLMRVGIPVPTTQSSYRDKILLDFTKSGGGTIINATKMRIYIYGIKFGSESQGLIAA